MSSVSSVETIYAQWTQLIEPLTSSELSSSKDPRGPMSPEMSQTLRALRLQLALLQSQQTPVAQLHQVSRRLSLSLSLLKYHRIAI